MLAYDCVAPKREFALKIHACVRRTRRWQAHKPDLRLIKQRAAMPTKGRLCGRPVKQNGANVRVPPQEVCKLIGHLATSHNRRIKASGPLATLQNIPDGDAAALQRRNPLRIRRVRRKVQQFTHDSPERILRMGVILPRRERRNARHAAQNEPRCLRIRDRRKTLNDSVHHY